MDITQSLILSIVEGLTEFLPISSTGHLVLVSHLLKIPQTEFVKSFEIFIQLGAILAVVVLYSKTFFQNFKVYPKLIAAFIPTAILGLIFYQFIKSFLLGNLVITLLALFLGGIVLILVDKILPEKPHHLDKIDKLSLKKSIVIGLFQSISMIPGVSRSAASIIGGLVVGLKRETAVEFSFLLAVPTLTAATILDLIKSDLAFSGAQLNLLAVGFVGSFITAILAIKLFINFVKDHSFFSFGVYRIVLSLVFWLIFLR